VKKLIARVLCLAVALAATGFALAQAPKADDKSDATTRLQKTLQARLPKIKIEKVQPSPWPYLYEVISDDEMFYVDTTGDYLFYGKVMDTRTKEDLTAKRWNELQQVDFASLPFELALKQVKGKGSRKLAVFADPHCPYCVAFEKTLLEVDNVTVFTFLYPLESIHPGATERAKQIWCAKNRSAAWSDWMRSKKETPATSCNTEQLTTLKNLGDKLKVTGTPTLIFEDGHRIPGAIPKDQLEQEFKTAAPKKS